VRNRTPKVSQADEVGIAVVKRLDTHGIIAMTVLEVGRVVGVIHLHALMRAGVV
jgi:arabinose-5-phosphate isomerase